MNEPLLTKIYYGNSLQEWLTALLIIFAALLVSRLAYWVFSRIIKRFTDRTSSRLDNILVDMVEEPVIFLISWFGIWYGISTLNLPESVELWVDKAFHVLIILTIGWLLVRLFESVFTEYIVPLAEKTESDMDDQLIPVVRKGTKTIIWVMALIIALDNAGYDVGALLAGLGIGGLALAMAAKDTVSNVFGGFTIFADKPFTLNDRVKVAGYDGMIREVGLRSTRLETLEGRIVTIPNAKFSDSPVENISLEPSRKVALTLGLTYDTTPEQLRLAMELLQKIGASNSELEEKVITAFTGFSESSLDLNFIYYIKRGADIFGAQTAVNLEILEAFNAHGLDFAYPTQTILTRQTDGASA